MPNKFRRYATTTYLQNRLSTKGTTKTQFELWYGRTLSVEYIRVFESLTYVYIPKQKRHKLDSGRKQTILLGYVSGSKGYKVMNLVITRHVVYFDEQKKVDKKELCCIPLKSKNGVLLHCLSQTESRKIMTRRMRAVHQGKGIKVEMSTLLN